MTERRCEKEELLNARFTVGPWIHNETIGVQQMYGSLYTIDMDGSNLKQWGSLGVSGLKEGVLMLELHRNYDSQRLLVFLRPER